MIPCFQHACCGNAPMDLDDAGRLNLSQQRKAKAIQSDQLISDALKEMTLEERERVHLDMHGVADAIEETPAFISRRLGEMVNEVGRLLETSKNLPCKAIKLAQLRDPDYVYNSEFLLWFLRTEDFLVDRAAVRCIRFFDSKMLLFGQDLLCKEITWNDLDSKDMKALKKGHFQILQERDVTGRRIGVFFQANQKYSSPESAGRVAYYSSMPQRSVEQEDKKMVWIVIHLGETSLQALDLKLTSIYARLSTDLPLSICAFHHCISNSSSSFFRLYMRLVLNPTTLQVKARVKMHEGTSTEWMYSLMTYGLPHQLLPITADGKIRNKNHLEFLEMKQCAEQNSREEQPILVPLRSDILMGKGKPISQHPGNMVLQMLLDEYVESYITSDKPGKTALVASIVSKVRDSKCRFLSKESGVWVEISDELARDKVGRRLRWKVTSSSGTTQKTAQKCGVVREFNDETASGELEKKRFRKM